MDRVTTAAGAPGSVRKRAKAVKVIRRVVLYLVLLLLACFFLFPFFVMFCLSILTDGEVVQQVLFSPSGVIEIGNYVSILTFGSDYLRYLWNTLQVSLILAVGIPIASSLCAFGFAKLNFHGRDVMYSIVLGTLMIPSVVTLVPLYVLYSGFGWINTLYPLWVPSLFGGGATNIFLLRQFMKGIPNDLISAAKIDGASLFRIYLTICMPLCAPILIYLGVSAFIASWGDYLTPSMYNNSTDAPYTLAYALYDMTSRETNSVHPEWIFAAATITSLVPTILFTVFQKYLIEGVQTAGLKG